MKESGAKANTRAQKKGAMTTVILLSSMDVTLTVSDGKKKDKKTVTVTVLQRSPQDWIVPFELVQEEGTLDAPCPSDKGWIGGANVCADDLDSSCSIPMRTKGVRGVGGMR